MQENLNPQHILLALICWPSVESGFQWKMHPLLSNTNCLTSFHLLSSSSITIKEITITWLLESDGPPSTYEPNRRSAIYVNQQGPHTQQVNFLPDLATHVLTTFDHPARGWVGEFRERGIDLFIVLSKGPRGPSTERMEDGRPLKPSNDSMIVLTGHSPPVWSMEPSLLRRSRIPFNSFHHTVNTVQ